jgi:hypothetical protein
MTGRWMEELRNKVPTGTVDGDGDAFAEHLRQRAEAAQKVEQGLLTEVPMLYGSPGPHEPEGDPGILIARLHRGELLRRSGAMPVVRAGEPPERLPYERFLIVLGFVLEAVYFFGRD